MQQNDSLADGSRRQVLGYLEARVKAAAFRVRHPELVSAEAGPMPPRPATRAWWQAWT